MKDIKTHNVLGIWMNYSSAFLTDLTNDSKAANDNLNVSMPQEDENKKVCKNNMITKELGEDQSEFFQKVSAVIDGYEEVLIFGDSEAKKEFSEFLSRSNLSKNIKIELRGSLEITESQLMAFYNA